MFCCIVGLSSAVMAKDFIYVPGYNCLYIIDCDTDTIVKTIEYNDYIVGAEFSPDGKRYYLNGWGKIYVIDTEKNELIDTYEFWSDLNRVTVLADIGVSRDNRYLYMNWAVCRKKLNIPRLEVLPPQFVVFDTQTKKIVRNFEGPVCATGIMVLKNDPDNVIIFAQDIFKFNIKTGKSKKVLGVLNPEPGKPGLNSLVIWDNMSPGDHGLFVNAAYTAEDIYYVIIDTNTGKISMLKGEEVVFAYSGIISPDKKYLYVVMDEVYKIDLKTGKTLAMDIVDRGTCYALAITADGKKLYVGPAGADVSVYDTKTMKCTGIIYLKSDGLVAHRLTK